MGLETFTGKVSDLVATNPPGTDPKSQGDDHLRGIKTTIIGQSVNMQLGQSPTATQNFTMTTGLNGTMKLARGNVGATTQDIMTVDANGKAVFPQMARAWNAKTLTAGVTYTNGTGNDISVSITMTSTSGTSTMALDSGGIRLCIAKAELNVSNGMLYGIIPAGGTFIVNGISGTISTLTAAILLTGPLSGITP